MTLLYPITRYSWLRNKEEGFPNYIIDVETKTKQRISKQLTFFQKLQDTLLTEGDNIQVNMKRHTFLNARLGRNIFIILLILFIIFEFILNYQNMQITIMPGQAGLLPILARVPSAFGLTTASFVFAHICFELLLHNLLEEDKIKYNFPDTNNTTSIAGAVEKRAGLSKMALLAICIILLGLTLYAIFLFSQARAAAFEGGVDNGKISHLTILAILVPPAGGIMGFFIKKNHNIMVAYKAMMRFKRIQDSDKKMKSNHVNAFSLRRARTLNREIARSYRRVIRFKNYLEAHNAKIRENKRTGNPFKVHGELQIANQNEWRERIRKILEQETLQYYDNTINTHI